MNAPLAVLSILALLGPGSWSSAPSGAAPAVQLESEGYEALVEEYELAFEAWMEHLRGAELEKRRELRDHHPAAAFWERFEKAAEEGEGRALLWMATHLREKGLRTKERRPAKRRLYEELFARHLEAEWFGAILDELPGEERFLEAERLLALYEQAIEKSPHPEVRAQAMVLLGQRLLESEDEAEKAAGKRWLQKASKDYADTRFGTLARAELEKPVVGEPAPDFVGRTIDGHEFRLSDYRGKVVLLDFYGFW